MKSKSKNDVIGYKKQHNLVLKLKKRYKKGLSDKLEKKIALNHFVVNF